MIKLDLIIPGLFGPFSSSVPDYIKHQLNSSEFNVVRKYLARAELSTNSAENYYKSLQYFINPRSNASICELTAAYDEVETSSGFLYRADPVHFKAESDHAILLGSELVAPSLDESLMLMDVFI